MTYWWLSFADSDLPPGQTHLGCAIVEGTTLPDACARAWDKGCNPGGEVAGVPIDFMDPMYAGVQPDRMLTPDEMERLGVKRKRNATG